MNADCARTSRTRDPRGRRPRRSGRDAGGRDWHEPPTSPPPIRRTAARPRTSSTTSSSATTTSAVSRTRLAAAGLSSLGRSEAHVLAATEEVLSVLARLNGHEPPPRAAGVALTEGHEFLAANAKALLGHAGRDAWARGSWSPSRPNRPDSRISVSRMTANGMDIARVNCAHDGPEVWERMIDHVRSTRRTNGHRPRIAMDLGGPKLRTGPLLPGPRVVRISPRRDRLGVVTAPALRVAHGRRRTGCHCRHESTVVPVDDAELARASAPGRPTRTRRQP